MFVVKGQLTSWEGGSGLSYQSEKVSTKDEAEEIINEIKDRNKDPNNYPDGYDFIDNLHIEEVES